jgi:mannosyltransferase OCH1-like enzyme
MIVKKIHYIWLGKGTKPNLVDICINSWREKLPEFEIIEWNEENLNFQEEISKNKFLQECYERKLWAFLSDYFRIKVLYKEGGIYLDTDMQILKNISPLLENDFFIGTESENILSAGIIGSIAQHPYLEKILEFYEEEIWNVPVYTLPAVLDWVLKKNPGLKRYMTIYPPQYFYPYHFTEDFNYSHIRPDTYGIHWWGKSWTGDKKKLYFLEFKHFRGIKKILVDFLITFGLMGVFKNSSLAKFVNRRIFKK